jgi:hypothetical protein
MILTRGGVASENVDFGQLLGGAWQITWRERQLWIVGFFAGSASGTCTTGFNSSVPSNQDFSIPPGLSRADLDQLQATLREALPLLIGLSVVLLVIYVAFWLLSVACRGAVISGGAEAASGAHVSLGQAWRSGTRAFGRLFGLDLLWLVAWLIVLGLVGLYALSVVRGQAVESINWLSVLIGLGSVLALLGIIASVLSVVIAYAQRSIVLDGAGPIDGLSAGFGIARRELGSSVILWLVSLVLSIGGGIALVIGLLIAALPAALVGGLLSIIINAAGGSGIPALIVTVAVVLIVGLLVGAAALNTFLWHFWTLGYLRLARPAPVAGPAPPASS